MTSANARLETAIKASAWYDLATCVPLALPGIAGAYLMVLDVINGAVGLGGGVGHLSPLAMMFVNFLGSLISIWAVLRLLRPTWIFALADVAVRALFSIAMLNAIFNGVPGLVAVLWVCEMGLLLAQAYLLCVTTRHAADTADKDGATPPSMVPAE